MMDILASLVDGFAVAITPTHLGLALFGCFVGTLMGALPGLGPVNGTAILIPLVFALSLSPTASLIMLTAVYYGTMYGGRISSIMLNIPGDEPAMMTTLDGYPMARAGKATEALAISAIASFVGATLATIGLTFFGPLLAGVAIYFGPADYFALYVMAFATIGGITSGKPVKALFAAVIGLMVGTVGLDWGTAVPRYTFGLYELYEGFDPIVSIVGLFAFSEVLVLLEKHVGKSSPLVPLSGVIPNFKGMKIGSFAMFRGSIVGFVAGVLPGAGASLGSFLAYTVEKRSSDKEGTFGKGDPRGVAAPEAGNNAASGGALIPMLTLGVPGSGTTAVLLALLVTFNVQPGPLLFDKQPEIVWGLIASLYIANVALLVLNIPLVGMFARMLSLPTWILMPFVVMVSFLGVYSMSRSGADVLMMIGFGVFGYILRKLDFSLVPIVLGILLGSHMEDNLRRALALSGGDISALFGSNISIGLYSVTAIILFTGFWFAYKETKFVPKGDEN